MRCRLQFFRLPRVRKLIDVSGILFRARRRRRARSLWLLGTRFACLKKMVDSVCVRPDSSTRHISPSWRSPSLRTKTDCGSRYFNTNTSKPLPLLVWNHESCLPALRFGRGSRGSGVRCWKGIDQR
ncbi:hypothetical protein LINPERHAP1_LOCUS4547 [Linum perenne]